MPTELVKRGLTRSEATRTAALCNDLQGRILRIGHMDWTINLYEDWIKSPLQEDEVLWGLCNTRECSIHIGNVSGVPSAHHLCDTVLHEISHAVYATAGITKKTKEEELVSRTTSVWVSLYRDNPWLVDWIKKAVR